VKSVGFNNFLHGQQTYSASAQLQFPLGYEAIIAADQAGRSRPILSLDSNDLPIGVPGTAGESTTVKVYAGHGDLYLVYVANNSGSDIIRGAMVKPTATTAHNYLVSEAGAVASNLVLGVALTKIPAGKTGWVVTRGKCIARAAGNIAANSVLIPAATGRVDVAAAITGATVGVVADTATTFAAGDPVAVFLKLR